jgi:hypothetical protein
MRTSQYAAIHFLALGVKNASLKMYVVSAKLIGRTAFSISVDQGWETT